MNHYPRPIKVNPVEIKELFDKEFARTEFDLKFSLKVSRFTRVFMHKGEHSAFFGSGLLAVHRVRWTSSETNGFFDDIINVDPDDLKDKIDALDNIDPNHIVTTDAFNLAVVYCVHRVMTSEQLPLVKRRETAVNLLRLLHFKFICSLLTNYFPYGTDLSIALQTYEAMNNRYDLKIYKTWANLITARAESILDQRGIHHATIMNFNNDDGVKYMVSDIQTRIRVVIKTLTALYYQIKAGGSKVISTSTLVEVDGGLEVRDIKRQFPKYRRYLFDIIVDTTSFVRPDLLELIGKAIPSMDVRVLLSSLNYLSMHVGDSKGNKVKDFVERTLEFSFDFIQSKGISPQNLPELLNGIKGVLNASRNKERDVMFLRTRGDEIVKLAKGLIQVSSSGKTMSINAPVSSERTGMILYIVLRTLTMNYYQSGRG